jgi:hypothetical protein
MREVLSFAIVGIAAAAVACGGTANRGENNASGRAAQVTNDSSPGTSGSNDSNNSGSRTTVSGCLTTGDQPGSYVLRASDTGAGGGTSGAASGMGSRYRVIADKAGDLSSNLNARVEVDGYIQPIAGTMGTSGNQSTTAGGASGTGGVSGNSGVSGATGITGTSGNRGSADATAGSSAGGAIGSSSNTDNASMNTIRATSIRKISDRCDTSASGAGNR